MEQWLTDKEDSQIFWLNGLAGTGKTAIAQTFAEISFADGKLGASFFCSRDSGDRSNLQAIFPTLAFQLAYKYPKFREQLVQVLRTNPDVGRESICSQLEKVIIRPFVATGISSLIIIDALDECEDKVPTSTLLYALSLYIREIPDVKFLITSRPESRIREGFKLTSLLPVTEKLELHGVERLSVDNDIRFYLKIRLADIRKTRPDCKLPEEWPPSSDIEILCEKTAGLFIYASMVVKFIASFYYSPTERLNHIISNSHYVDYEEEIDQAYTQILDLAFRDVRSNGQELYSRLRFIVGAVVLVFDPLSKKALSDLLINCRDPSDISISLYFLHSLLHVPDNEDDPICVLHKSLSHFLTDRGRCKDERFFIDPSIHHENIMLSCLDLMKRRLKRNICGLANYAILSDVSDLPARRETHIGSSLEYACRFWTRHLIGIPGSGPHVQRVQEGIDEFLATHSLCWIEVLSITGNLGTAAHAINDIREWYISVSHSTALRRDPTSPMALGGHSYSKSGRQ